MEDMFICKHLFPVFERDSPFTDVFRFVFASGFMLMGLVVLLQKDNLRFPIKEASYQRNGESIYEESKYYRESDVVEFRSWLVGKVTGKVTRPLSLRWKAAVRRSSL